MSEPQKANINRDTSHIDKKVISNMEFISIQDEMYREYTLAVKPDMDRVVRISGPEWLFVRPSGAHMVLDCDGQMHYIPHFFHLVWKNKPGAAVANF